MGKADLHTHTTASDGDLTATELVLKAKEKGLKTIAITDHDTIKGYLAAKDIAEKNGLQLLSGVEITAKWSDREVHILAYHFDSADSRLHNLLNNQAKARRLRMKVIVRKLQKQGIAIDYEEVLAESYGGNIGRPHAAQVLVQKGYVRSVQEAFIRYLGSDVIKNIQTEYADIPTVADVIKQAGGVLSVAHPGHLYSDSDMEQLLSFGVDGIECIHPSHNFDTQKKFSQMAKANHLLITGGSDFHGKSKTDYDPYFGIVTLGNQHVDALIRTSENRRLTLKKYSYNE